MLIDFFLKLKSHRLPVSIKEYLTLLEAMGKDVIGPSIDEFYYLSRAALVKDEANFDKFDRAFSEFWQGVETIPGIEAQIPLEWLLKQVELHLSEEEKKQIQALGGWEKLMETLKKRLEEQKGRHQGGAKWIGTGGTSPFGAYGYNPEGVRIGQEKSRNRSAVKVWDQREYRNLDDSVELGTRNIKVALRRLRKFAREGAPDESGWEVDPEALAILLFTSGTTGTPKAAVLRHRHVVSYVLGSVEFGAADEADAGLVSVPPYHVAGIAAANTGNSRSRPTLSAK